MAGVTNAPFRRLCRRYGGGLYVSEMITARALVEGNPKTMRMIAFAADEQPRSLQLYGTDPAVLGRPSAAWPARTWSTTSTSTSVARHRR